MNRILFVLSLVLLASGAVLATGAFTTGDEISPDAGIYLNPAETEHGDLYATFTDDDELAITVQTPPYSTTIVDDVFVVSFAGTENGDETQVWFTPEDEELMTIYRMDTREPVHNSDSAITLASGESVSLGFVFDTDEPGTKDETMTIQANVPDADPGPDPDPVPDPDPDPSPDPGPDPEPDPDPGEIPLPDPPSIPDPDFDLFPVPDLPEFDDPTDQGEPEDTGPEEPGPVEIEPEEEELAVPGLGGVSVDFGTFLVPWYVWLVLFAVLTTTVDYLTQTQLRRRVGLSGVLPLLRTPRETRKQRLVYALSRLGLLWVTVLVLALAAMALLWTVGIQGWVLFVTLLVASIVLGLALGYLRLPDIEGDYVDREVHGTTAVSGQTLGAVETEPAAESRDREEDRDDGYIEATLRNDGGTREESASDERETDRDTRRTRDRP